MSFQYQQDQLTQEIIELTSQFVSIPAQTDLNNEQAIAEAVSSTLSRFGLNPLIIGPQEHPSVICKITKGPGPVIWLESPLDTVPAGDPANWNIESPFLTETVGDRMYGRGVADARLAISLYSVLAREIANDSSFKGTLFLAFDADEQSGGFTGIREIMKQGPKPDGIILGYQGSSEISIGARGILRLWLRIYGQSAHPGSRSRKGTNAISLMAKAITALEQLPLASSTNDYFPFGSQLQPTLIKGGDALNKVPDCCSTFLDIRLLPNMEKSTILAQINNTLSDLTTPQENCTFSLEEVQHYPGFLTSPDSRLVRILKDQVLSIKGEDIPLTASGPTSVGCVLADIAPVINCYGVSSGNVHADNEWILLKDIPDIYQTWYQTVIKFCQPQ